jgi:caffeoyl-CoA O-methyltransferase
VNDNNVTITDPRVEDYTLVIARLGGNQGLPEQLPPVLEMMEELADRLSFPISGPLLGRMLYMLAGLSGARRIFDAGSGFGYSSTWLAAGAGAGASIICVDTSAEHLTRAREFHRRGGLLPTFDYRVGDAVATLEAESGPFDLIYNDVDKGSYPQMAGLAVDRLRPGGLYIADNALWYGKVCSSRTTRDAWTAAVDHHNQWIFANKQLFATILDQREGLLIAVKT